MSIASLSRVVPSTTLNALISPVFQQTDWTKAISGLLTQGDIADDRVYIPIIRFTNTSAQVVQGWNTAIDRADLIVDQLEATVYSINSRISFNTNDAVKFNRLTNRSLLDTYEDIVDQGVALATHMLAFYGANAQAKQGIIANATQTALPADSAGATKLSEYDLAEMMQFLNKIVMNIRSATYNMVYPTVIYAPTEAIAIIEQALIPFLNSANSGSLNSVGGTLNFALREAGLPTIEFIADDTLKGKGAGGNDLMLFVAPKIRHTMSGGKHNQNILNDEEYNAIHNTFMITTVENMKEVNPQKDFTYSSLQMTKMTTGWVVRPESVYAISYEY